MLGFKAVNILGGMAMFCSLAAAQDLPENIKKAGSLVIANMPNYPPLEFKDPRTSTLQGLDIDLGNAIAGKLGIRIRWSEMSFEQVVPAISTGRVDLVLSGMSDLPSRRDTMVFVDCMVSGAQFYTNHDRASQFSKATDLCGQKVGASRRSAFPAEIDRWSKVHCEAQGRPAIEVIGTEGSVDARTQLKQRRIAAALQGAETLPYLMQMEPNTYALVGAPITSVYQGIGLAKDNVALRDAIAGALKQLMEEGTYQSIMAKWNLGNMAVDRVMINSEARATN
ncbi:MAG: ABC transporter substrate-binding protein [Rhizobiales bacterium]|nr:ABC transporter substrate-binding protein [Hyphomicrobiales bacterium]